MYIAPIFSRSSPPNPKRHLLASPCDLPSSSAFKQSPALQQALLVQLVTYIAMIIPVTGFLVFCLLSVESSVAER